jgi:5-methylcytosine-specific restriction endonuclease McrA
MTVLKLCARRGCRRAIASGRRYCDPHRRTHRADRQARPIERIYDSTRWRNKTRPAVLERDRHCCVFCGVTSGGIHVAHIAPTQQLVAAGLDPFDPGLCVATCLAHNSAAAELLDVDDLTAREMRGRVVEKIAARSRTLLGPRQPRV